MVEIWGNVSMYGHEKNTTSSEKRYQDSSIREPEGQEQSHGDDLGAGANFRQIRCTGRQAPLCLSIRVRLFPDAEMKDRTRLSCQGKDVTQRQDPPENEKSRKSGGNGPYQIDSMPRTLRGRKMVQRRNATCPSMDAKPSVN